MNTDRKRAVAELGSGVGQMRYEVYKGALDRIKKAMDAGFHLEAITLLESLIADRLESRLNYLNKDADGKNYSFKALGDLIKGFKDEADKKLWSLVTKELDDWRIKRNASIHEMAKIEEGKQVNWDERMAELAPIAEKGLELFREINKRVGDLKK